MKEYNGKKVREAREEFDRELENNKLTYWEPQGTAISHSGDKCIVALCHHW